MKDIISCPRADQYSCSHLRLATLTCRTTRAGKWQFNGGPCLCMASSVFFSSLRSVLSILGGQFSRRRIQLLQPTASVNCTSPHISALSLTFRKDLPNAFSEALKTWELLQSDGAWVNKPSPPLLPEPIAEFLHLPHAHKTVSFQGLPWLQIDSLL